VGNWSRRVRLTRSVASYTPHNTVIAFEVTNDL
jgi:hypothetical protein